MAGTGKGRVSNDLVAASCAAVLAVYAAGYWRTRDAARSLDAQAQQRRPVRAESRVPVVPPATPATPDMAAADAAPMPVPVEPLPQAPSTGTPAAAADELAAVTGTTPQSGAPAAADEPPAAAASLVAKVPAANVPAAVKSPLEQVPEEGKPAAVEPTSLLASSSTPVAVPGASTTAQTGPEVPAEPYWRDGTFTGWGTSRHGDIKAQVVIHAGRIVESSIVSCETRYPCDVISTIIPQPVQSQSPEVDRVSRATESADAYYYALVNALAEALVEPALTAAAPR